MGATFFEMERKPTTKSVKEVVAAVAAVCATLLGRIAEDTFMLCVYLGVTCIGGGVVIHMLNGWSVSVLKGTLKKTTGSVVGRNRMYRTMPELFPM